jgi:ABC-type glycerol-3-phosphate transport system substrate-binding protein
MFNGESMRHTVQRRTLIGLSATLLALTTVGVGTTNAATATTFYAAPGGTGNACTTNNPCSVSTAQQKVRAATASNTDITVLLADGTYQLGQTLTFDAALGDSAACNSARTWTIPP